MFARIILVYFTGMFKYSLVMSNEAKVKCSDIGVSFRFWIRSLVFFMLKMSGNGANWLILCVNNLNSL